MVDDTKDMHIRAVKAVKHFINIKYSDDVAILSTNDIDIIYQDPYGDIHFVDVFHVVDDGTNSVLGAEWHSEEYIAKRAELAEAWMENNSLNLPNNSLNLPISLDIAELTITCANRAILKYTINIASELSNNMNDEERREFERKILKKARKLVQSTNDLPEGQIVKSKKGEPKFLDGQC